MYGSLMYPEVLAALLGRVPARRETCLSGFRTMQLGDLYPGLVQAEPSASVPAVLLGDLTADEWALIDRFEDPVYRLDAVVVDGGPAFAYVLPAGHDHRPAWDKARFDAELSAYVARCRRFVERDRDRR